MSSETYADVPVDTVYDCASKEWHVKIPLTTGGYKTAKKVVSPNSLAYEIGEYACSKRNLGERL